MGHPSKRNPSDSANPTIEPLGDRPGVHIVDRIENVQWELHTESAVSPTPADPEPLAYPVGNAARVDVTTISLPVKPQIHVRTRDGDYVDTFEPASQDERFVEGGRLLEVSSTSMKVYLRAERPTTLRVNEPEDAVELAFDSRSSLLVGVRSYHERPAGTVTTPADPEAVLEALSVAGSALKTLSCERSFPTLRGHPPRIELGESLQIPDALSGPETEITLAIPPEWECIYPAAPLAFYLGATVEPSRAPFLSAGDASWEIPRDEFGSRVRRLLRRTLFLDCVVRTEGLYPIRLSEREAVEHHFDTDLSTVYDESPAARLQRYMSIPWNEIAEHVPTWHVCFDVDPSPGHVEALPYLLDDLALIRSHDRTEVSVAEAPPESKSAVDSFLRSQVRERNAESSPTFEEDLFSLPRAGAVEQAYLGDGIPIAKNKVTQQSLSQRLDVRPDETDCISVEIVCNDPEMESEEVVENFYGQLDFLQFDVRIWGDRSTVNELEDVIEGDVDLLHYIGHIDHEGIQCRGGKLDLTKTRLDAGIDAFVLNGCSSFEQGRSMIESGAAAGVATLNTVDNRTANKLGQTVARSLNAGFSLRSALQLAKMETAGANQYIVLGDGGIQLSQSSSGSPYVFEVVDLEGKMVDIEILSYPTSNTIGGFTSPLLADDDMNYLTYGSLDRFYLTREEFVEYVGIQHHPVIIGTDLYWSNELGPSKLKRIFEDIESGSHGGVSNTLGRHAEEF